MLRIIMRLRAVVPTETSVQLSSVGDKIQKESLVLSIPSRPQFRYRKVNQKSLRMIKCSVKDPFGFGSF